MYFLYFIRFDNHHDERSVSFSLLLNNNSPLYIFPLDLGHCRTRTLPISGRSFLPRSRCLYPGARYHFGEILRAAEQLEGRVLGPGQPPRPGQLLLRGDRKQSRQRVRAPSAQVQGYPVVQVPGPEANSLFRDFREGRYQGRGGLPGGGTGGSSPGFR